MKITRPRWALTMGPAARLATRNTPTLRCWSGPMSPTTPPLAHHLPWYFGLTMVVVWAVVLMLIAVLVYHRRQTRLTRRGERRAPRGSPDDRCLGPGSDLEPW